MAKINKDNYYMNIAKLVSERSIDPNSQFGCVAVGSGGAILSTGYNGPPRGVDDSKIPLTRPEKYTYMEHAERNCIYNAARIGIPLEGCTFYVTGIPCIDCLRAMYQVGAKKINCLNMKANMNNADTFIDFMNQYVEIVIWN